MVKKPSHATVTVGHIFPEIYTDRRVTGDKFATGGRLSSLK